MAGKSDKPEGLPGEPRAASNGSLVSAGISALVGAAVALAGVFLTAHLQEQQSARTVQIDHARQILAKRIDIVEKAARILNHRHHVSTIDTIIVSETGRMEICLLARLNDCDKYGFDKKWAYELKTEKDNINSDFATLINLVMIYFDDDTRVVMRDIASKNSDWWKIEDEKIDALLRAMALDLKNSVANISGMLE